MELRDVVTVVCLLLGAALVLARLWSTYQEGTTAAALAAEAQKVEDGAKQVEVGAATVQLPAEKVTVRRRAGGR